MNKSSIVEKLAYPYIPKFRYILNTHYAENIMSPNNKRKTTKYAYNEHESSFFIIKLHTPHT